MRAGSKFIRRAKITNGEMRPAQMTVNYREDQEEPVEIVFKVDEAEGKTQQLLMARMSGTEALGLAALILAMLRREGPLSMPAK